MKPKTIVTIGAVIVSAYWTGKLKGICIGAEEILNKYKDIIPDDKVTYYLVKKKGFKISVTAKKGETN